MNLLNPFIYKSIILKRGLHKSERVISLEGSGSLTQWLNSSLIITLSLIIFSVKSRVAENAAEQLRPSQRIRQRQMPLRRPLLHLPRKLRRKAPVIVLLHLRALQLLHPPNLDEQRREISIQFLPNPPLHAVPELPLAVLPPQGVNFPERLRGDELDL